MRISARPDPRGDYVVQETRELAPGETSAELPLGEQPLRVHVLGRTRDGRLLRRAVISGLTARQLARPVAAARQRVVNLRRPTGRPVVALSAQLTPVTS